MPSPSSTTGDRSVRQVVRLAVVTSLYPTPDRPEVGPFVAQRVLALRDAGVEVSLIAADSYARCALRRHAEMLGKAMGLHDRIDGVEGHVLFPAGLIALALATARGVPLIVYAHGSDVAESAHRTFLHTLLARHVARRAAAVVTNSRATARLVEALGRTALVIPPGVDMSTFCIGSRSEARRISRLAVLSLTALFVGRLTPDKGADVFAEAISRSPDWVGVMVGEGELRGHIEREHPGIHLAGGVAPSAVPGWVRSADVVIVPSRHEGLGLVAVEALACGVPVIASEVGGLREVVVDRKNGRLVPPGDADAISAALEELRDPQVRNRLAATARASVIDHDLQVVTARMAAVWESVGVPLNR